MMQLIRKNTLLAACALGFALAAGCTTPASAQTAAPGTIALKPDDLAKLAPAPGPKYDNRWEIYGGLNLMNGQAGQNLPKRYNMGGVEMMGTYWLGGPQDGWRGRLGVVGDYRIGAGTTPVLSPYYNRVLVYQNIFAGGVQYRGPKNRYAAVDFHGLAGATRGTFDHAVKNYPGVSPVSSCPANQLATQRDNLGLYCNKTAPWFAVGGSIDFNESQRLAIRLSPDMVFEHFGTETREFFAISGGVMYRFGHR